METTPIAVTVSPTCLEKRYAAIAAVEFPGASVFSGQKILVAAFGFRQAAGDGPHLDLGCRLQSPAAQAPNRISPATNVTDFFTLPPH